jgi:two-component system, OmpR family, copper resistance phosphate regulon response regulator CusR
MRILIVEDEARIRDFVTRGLEAEGFSVQGADDGVSGLKLAVREQFDLIVLDLLLPGMDGLTLLSGLRDRQPDVPVLILSARSDMPTKLHGFRLGATDYLSKPFSLGELIARIRAHTRRAGTPVEGAVLTAGRLVLDLTRRQARIGALVADLSDREFHLLLHLVEHPGEVVSRERLLSDVWGYHFDPGSNVVDVCVRRLRKKLGPEAPIETVRNAGYRLLAA